MKILVEGKLPEMKVIKKGILPRYEGTCKVCNCVVESYYKEFDMFRKTLSFELDSYYMSITCPTKGCGNSISLHLAQKEMV